MMADTSKKTADLAVRTSQFVPISEQECLRDLLLGEEKKQLEDQDEESVKDNFDVIASAHDDITNALTRMAISCQFPFKIVRGEGLRALTASLRPDYQMPSSLAGPIVKVFCEEKKKLKNLFKRMEHMFCLSIDTWTSVHELHYMCLTVHYIDDNWSRCKKLLSFAPFAYPESLKAPRELLDESRKDIGEIVQKCLDEWGIDRIFAVVVGTASSNEMAIDYLKDEYSAKEGRTFSSKFMHMTCVVHIVNFLVVDVLRNFSVSVERISGMVRYVKVRPDKLARFKECMAMEGVDDKPKLTLDWCTRWDTTYFMLDAALKYEEVWKRYEKEDPDIAVDLRDEDGVPETGDWDRARVLHTFLKCFYDLTKKISTSKCGISLVFHEIVAINSTLKKWNESDNPDLKTVASKVQEMYDKHWGNPEMINKLIYIAAILDPRFKLGYVQSTMEHLHENVEVVERMKGELKEALYDLFNEYGKKLEPTVDKGRSLPETSDEKNGDDKAKSELDTYLLEATEKWDPKLDILLWWEGNSIRFPILSRMACDVFTTPVSISPESAFIIKGQVLDEYMSSLSVLTREVLLCARDWLTGSFLLPDDVDVEDQEDFDMEDGDGDDDNHDDDNDEDDDIHDNDNDEDDDGYFFEDYDEEDYEDDDAVDSKRRKWSL